MSELLQQLTRNCFSDRDATAVAQEQTAQWQSWLLPVTEDSPVGEDPAIMTIFADARRNEQIHRAGADADAVGIGTAV